MGFSHFISYKPGTNGQNGTTAYSESEFDIALNLGFLEINDVPEVTR